MQQTLNNTCESAAKSTTYGRIQELDGLRGIAILMVVFFHYGSVQLSGNTNPIAKIFEKATYFGWAGVDLFFVLSGFLICSILLKYRHSKNYFSTFYKRRVLRIFPVYFLLLLIYIILSHLPLFSNFSFLTEKRGVPLWSYFAMLQNFYMANANSLGNKSLSVTWSISIEEQFYIIFPFIVFYFKKWWLLLVLLLSVIAAPIFRSQYSDWVPGYVLLHSRMDALSFGALIAFFNYYADVKSWVDKYYFPLILILIASILSCFIIHYANGEVGTIRHTLFGIFFSGLLLLAITKKSALFAVVLRNKYLTRIGAISYSLYLFHFIILGICHFLFGNDHIGIENAKDVLITLFALSVSFIFSYFIYRFYETPAVLKGKKIQY